MSAPVPGMAGKAKAAAPHVGNLGGLGLAFYFLWQSLTAVQDDLEDMDRKIDTLTVQVAELSVGVGGLATMAADNADDIDKLEDAARD